MDMVKYEVATRDEILYFNIKGEVFLKNLFGFLDEIENINSAYGIEKGIVNLSKTELKLSFNDVWQLTSRIEHFKGPFRLRRLALIAPHDTNFGLVCMFQGLCKENLGLMVCPHRLLDDGLKWLKSFDLECHETEHIYSE